MSFGSSNMAASLLVMASCLLLRASIIQGFQDEVFYLKKIEVLVGQNVTLPCFVKNAAIQIASIEWRKMSSEDTKIALYNSQRGTYYFWPNVTIQTEDKSLGSLHMSRVSKWDSGVYVCDLSTFPLGSLRRETQLEVKDVEITCDANSTVEVHAGGNVFIHCSLFPHAQYSWTKDKKLVPGNESLVLWKVTEAHTGVYTLAVNTGAESVYKEFIITVLTETTSLSTDLVTFSPQTNTTEVGFTQTTDSNFTTYLTPGISTINTTSTTKGLTPSHSQPNNVTPTSPNDIRSTPMLDPHRLNNFTNQNSNMSTLPDQLAVSNSSSTLSYSSMTFSPTQETWNNSRGGATSNDDLTTTPSAGNTTPVTEKEDTTGVRSHLLVVITVLVLIAVGGFLYGRHMYKQRMDLPPSFKPPPPPVKYTSARQREIYTHHYPTSRCNSVNEFEDVRLNFIV